MSKGVAACLSGAVRAGLAGRGGRREERGVRPAPGPGSRGRSEALGAPAAAEGEGEPKSDISPLWLQAPANGPWGRGGGART